VFDHLNQQKEDARKSYDEYDEYDECDDEERFFEEEKLQEWFDEIVRRMPGFFAGSQFATEEIVRYMIFAKKQEDETYKAVVDDLKIR
jgi:hypothetical protein